MVETENKPRINQPRVNPEIVSEVLGSYRELEKNTDERFRLLRLHSEKDSLTGRIGEDRLTPEERIEVCKGLLPPPGEYVLLLQTQIGASPSDVYNQCNVDFVSLDDCSVYFMRITEPKIKISAQPVFPCDNVNTGDIFIQFMSKTVRSGLHTILSLEDAIDYIGWEKGQPFNIGMPGIELEVPLSIIESLVRTGKSSFNKNFMRHTVPPLNVSIGNKRIARALKECFGDQNNYDEVFSRLDFIFEALSLESKWEKGDLTNLSSILRSYFSDKKELVCVTPLDERSLFYVRAVANAGFNAEHYDNKSCRFNRWTPKNEIKDKYDWLIEHESIVNGICNLNLKAGTTAQKLIYPVQFEGEDARVLTCPKKCDVVVGSRDYRNFAGEHYLNCLGSAGLYISRAVDVPRFLDNNPEFEFHSATHRGEIITNPDKINSAVSNNANPVYSVFKKKLN